MNVSLDNRLSLTISVTFQPMTGRKVTASPSIKARHAKKMLHVQLFLGAIHYLRRPVKGGRVVFSLLVTKSLLIEKFE